MSYFLESTSLEVLILLVTVAVLLYRYATSTFGYWKQLGVVYMPPTPFFGNSFRSAFALEADILGQQRAYNFFGENRYGGRFAFRRPTLMIKDPDLIEQVLIKDFSTFYNRGFTPDLELDPLAGHLVNLQDGKWKNLRNKLTPAFSSGKLKGMHDQLLQCGDNLVNYLEPLVKRGDPIDIKYVMSGFAMDLIGSVAFGLTLNSLENPDSEFKKLAEGVFKASFKLRLRFAVRSQFPQLIRFLKWKALPKETEDFFINVVKDTIKYREDNNIQRNDFLQILMELKKQEMLHPNENDDMKFDDVLMTSNAFVFLVAGYDTTANAITYMLYELAEHADIQGKLYNEIQEKIKKHGGPTYEAVKEMTYLDQVLSEALRKYPPAPGTARVANQSYKVPNSDLVIPKGTLVTIPIYSLHHDPKHYPNPEKFDPSRFADESKIRKGTYLPFGDGPRICIGLRIARLEAKIAAIKILLKYKLEVHEKTQRPFKYNPKSVFLNPIGGIWLTLTERV